MHTQRADQVARSGSKRGHEEILEGERLVAGVWLDLATVPKGPNTLTICFTTLPQLLNNMYGFRSTLKPGGHATIGAPLLL